MEEKGRQGEKMETTETRLTAAVPKVTVYSRHRKGCKLYGVESRIGWRVAHIDNPVSHGAILQPCRRVGL